MRVLQMSVKDITPEFLREFKLKNAIMDILEQYSPWLRCILLTAAQTLRSANKNTIKKVEQVSLTLFDAHSKYKKWHCRPVPSFTVKFLTCGPHIAKNVNSPLATSFTVPEYHEK